MKRFTFALVTVALLSIGLVHAKKPDKPGGGGGGSGGSDTLFTLVDLGGLTGGDFIQSEAYDLNNPDSNGRVQLAGFSHEPIAGSRNDHAAVWDVDSNGTVTKVTDIHPQNYTSSVARQINDFGQAIVGGLLWIPGQGLTTLPGFGDGIGHAWLLNKVGGILGMASDSYGGLSVVMWRVDVQGNIAGPFAIDFGDGSFIPTDMNDLEFMAGYITTSNGDRAAIGYVDEFGVLQVTELGVLSTDHSLMPHFPHVGPDTRCARSFEPAKPTRHGRTLGRTWRLLSPR